jgi:hypothetical protein
MDREQRFINLVQTLLLVREQRGYWPHPTASRRLSEGEILECLDDAYFFAGKSPEMMQLELDKLAISYVNNWLNNSPGWKRDVDGE